ncbi:hypothetical protein KUCAC02_008196 [Chaenocephalus aceratus]|uniref:Uncharacterized protein n=1 Tax=Chaenocephalus aceratus TaxID=36190 RepID=A0ACB9X9U1_CHAAC|nr:hypothetical protein KUCAC02_008196 [Chaenocephalus aceratus]
MEHRELQQDLEAQWGQVVSRLQGKLFQSDWDIASFTVFFIFIVVVCCYGERGAWKHSPQRALAALLPLALEGRTSPRVFNADTPYSPRRHKVGIENMALQP